MWWCWVWQMVMITQSRTLPFQCNRFLLDVFCFFSDEFFSIWIFYLTISVLHVTESGRREKSRSGEGWVGGCTGRPVRRPQPLSLSHLHSSRHLLLPLRPEMDRKISHWTRWKPGADPGFWSGGPAEFWPQGRGPWAQNLLKIRGFPSKWPQNCMIIKHS